GGITELPDGFSINIGNQSLWRKPEHSFDLNLGAGNQSYDQDGEDLFIPNFYMTYNRDDWAVWGGIYVPGGGAVVDYPNGSITTALIGLGAIQQAIQIPGLDLTNVSIKDESLKAESLYLAFTLGGTYEINEMVSFAAGLRYIDAKNSVKGGATLVTPIGDQPLAANYDESDEAFGYILGMNINPMEKMNIGIQYQSKVKLDLKADVKATIPGAGLPADGSKSHRYLPAMLGLGLGYDMEDNLYIEVNYSYWFQKYADWDEDAAGRDISDMAGDTHSIGATGTYKINKEIAVSTGIVFTDFMWKDRNGYYDANIGSYEVLYSDNYQFSCGVSWQINDIVEINTALGRTLWQDAS
ncbi:MAG: outer membrane beta-barrel protein, partial [Bacteroidetes bacterium]|nr:outer membrane beta-barrel protein [Bacteroidota bacterium]